VIDRTSAFVARSANPPQFEEKIRENQRNDPKFSFLNPADPYHAYYRHRMARVAAGEAEEDGAGAAGAAPKDGEAPAPERAPVDVGKEPPAPEFILDMPPISAIDL
jgi:splicing factor 3A subunit 1